jgi:hypothetical protein
VDEDRSAGDELARPGRVADVAAELVDSALEARLVERRQVERADDMAVGEGPREVQAEEARAA